MAGVTGVVMDLVDFGREQLRELLSFFVIFILRLALQLYDLIFHRRLRAKTDPSAVVALVSRKLTEAETSPMSDFVEHSQIHGEFYGWFREQTYHVPLEIGKTVLSRRRACRHINKTHGALLLVHGFGQNRFAWHTPGRSVVNFLAEAGYDVFYVDLRGTRDSIKLGAHPPRAVHQHVQVDLLQALRMIEAVSDHPRVVLLGHSLGGALSCATASAHPRYIEGVVHIAGLYGFKHHTNFFWKALFLFVNLFETYFPRTPKDLVLPTREIGQILRHSHFVMRNRLGRLLPIKPYLIDSTESAILTEYLRMSFECATFGVMQCITDLSEGKPFCDDKGNDYLALFDTLNIPLLVICASRDDLVHVKDSLSCFERSASHDKQKIVFASDEDEGKSRQLAFGHCDILIGKLAVNHVWEKLRIWLDERKKLQQKGRESGGQRPQGKHTLLVNAGSSTGMLRSKSVPSIVALGV